MAEVQILEPNDRIPQNTSYVVVTEERQDNGSIYYVTGAVVGKMGGPMPSGRLFYDVKGAMDEAQKFASAHGLTRVYVRPVR